MLRQIRSEFEEIGYAGGLIRDNYEFADILSSRYEVRQIPLAVFAQDPPSYRTAAFGVTFANGKSGPEFVQDHRALGAPQILEIHGDYVFRWKMNASGMPELLDKAEVDQLSSLFSSHRDDWSPRQILNAKSMNPVARQLDFFDLDLMPLLDFEVRTKLDCLLRDTVSLGINTIKKRAIFTDDYYPPLFRLIFRLLASKLLGDRDYQGDWLTNTPQAAVQAVENLYFGNSEHEAVLQDQDTQFAVWQCIQSTFHFQNLSVDSLAYVYENTLVTPQTRRLYGIHSTPPAVAEYVVRGLPFEDLGEDDRRVFEPFSGHAVFLVAAMQRMRELLAPDVKPRERHDYFVEMLSGIEVDDFAREVAGLSLMLADYPNPDGWRLHAGDALKSPVFNAELRRSNVVLCNPPFEDFSLEERKRYPGLTSTHKPAEVLYRVLRIAPALLGFVLPRVFLDGRGYQRLRAQLGDNYSSIEVLALPDRVFQHSDAESVLLLCSGLGRAATNLRTGRVGHLDHRDFRPIRATYETTQRSYKSPGAFAESMWQPELRDVWDATEGMQRLEDVAAVHRGVEYCIGLRENRDKLMADTQRPGFVPGLHLVKGSLESYFIRNTLFLNASPELMGTNSYRLAWHEPKVIVNARRRSRGAWKISASTDEAGLMCYQNFHAVWPYSALSLEVMAAVLNGPVANAFVATRASGRDIQVRVLRAIPVPEINKLKQHFVESLVHDYSDTRGQWLSGRLDASEAEDRCARLLAAIDAEILKAYDLRPDVERGLLDYFNGHARPGPVDFTQYFPLTFQPHIPWHIYISEDFRMASGKHTLERLPVVPASRSIDEVLAHME